MKTKDGISVKPFDTVYRVATQDVLEVTVKEWMADAMPYYYGTMQAAAADLVEQLNNEIQRLERRRDMYATISNIHPVK